MEKIRRSDGSAQGIDADGLGAKEIKVRFVPGR
jgi:hypothetical protein